MLPVGDVNPTRRRAVLTGAFVLANVVVFLLLQAPLHGCDAQVFVYRYSAVPREALSMTPLDGDALRQLLGACAAELDGPKHVPLSLVTSMFLHGNLLHLLGNMLFLWVFGNNVEDRLGRPRFVLFYVVGGLAATSAFAVLHADTIVPLLGASGAIAAILGAYLVMFPRARVHTYVPFPLYLLALLLPRVQLRSVWIVFAIVTMPAWLLLGGWFVLQAVAAGETMTDGVAYEAHVAGFVAGLVLVLLLDRGRQRRGQPTFHPVRDHGVRRRRRS